jgi:hypothetical protein
VSFVCVAAISSRPDLLQLRTYSIIYFSMLQPGKPLKQCPQYVIGEEIGAGGFGVTYNEKKSESG